MGIPLNQALSVGAYVIGQHLRGNKRYPLVLMLEPLFRCNLACAGGGKIDYPDKILNQRISVADALHSMDECGAPVVVLAGGEPLLHKELPEIVEGALAKGKFVTVCTNALLLEKKIHLYKPHKNFNWSIHLDGDKEMHDRSVCQKGVYDRAIEAIKIAKAKGFRVNINTTLFSDAKAEQVANFLDEMKKLGIGGVTISPGYAYERAPDQQHFLNRTKTKQLFRDIFKLGKGGRAWPFFQSAWIFSPAIRPTIARPGVTRRARCSVGSVLATCSVKAMPRPSRSLWKARIGTSTGPATTKSAPTAWSTPALRQLPSWTR